MIVQSQPLSEEIYFSKNLHAAARVFDRTKPICIIFGNAASPQTPFRPALLKHKINFVFVACRATDWWQYPDLADAERAIREFTAPFPKRVTYGDSMGAYGALLCSAAVGADIVLAGSPQATIRPGEPKGDTRWERQRVRIQDELGFPNDDMASRLTKTGDVIIVYDPTDFDRHHVALIDAIRPTRKLYFPLAGHATTRRLNEVGMLSRLMRDVVAGEFDLPRFQRELQAGRGHHKAAWLLERVSQRGRTVQPALAGRVVESAAPLDRSTLRTALIALLNADRPDLLQRAVLRLLQETDYAATDLLLVDCKKFAKPLAAAGLHGEVLKVLAAIGNDTTRENVMPALLAAACLHFHAGDPETAFTYAQTAGDWVTAWNPGNAHVAEFMELIGRPEQAKVHQNRVLASDSVDFATIFKMAGACHRRQDWHQAVKIWTQAVEKGAEPKRVAFDLANALSKTGQYREALDALRPLLEASSVAPGVWRLQGRCAVQVGDDAEAARAFRKVVELDPADAVGHRLLSDTLTAMGDLAAAHAHALKAQELKPSPSNARHLDHLTKLLAVPAHAAA